MSPPIEFMQDVEAAIAHGSGARRADMLRQVTELFVDNSAHYSDDEIRVFDDVLFLLAAEIEVAARAALATRLALIANAPPALMNHLASDEAIEVAWPVLSQSERVAEDTLVACAMTRGQQHLLAISRRQTLGARVTDILVARGERPVLIGLAGNPGACFSELGYQTLIARSEYDDELILRIGERDDLPRPLLIKLIAGASDLVRAKLKVSHPEVAVEEAVRVAADRIQTALRAESPRYALAQAMIDNLHRAGQLRDADVEAFARAGQFEETATALARLCDMSVEGVERAIVNDRAENVLVLVKAAGLSRATAKAVLQLRAASVHPTPGETEAALAAFERLKPATAQELVRFYRLRDNPGLTGPAATAH